MPNYTPEHLHPYERPSNYIGATHYGTYVVYSTHRDARKVEELERAAKHASAKLRTCWSAINRADAYLQKAPPGPSFSRSFGYVPAGLNWFRGQ